MTTPKIPKEIIEEIKLGEPMAIKKTVTLIQDTKHTKQFSIKLPIDIIEKIKWKAGDKIEIEIDNTMLKLKQVKVN